jgi:hypothetical protein
MRLRTAFYPHDRGYIDVDRHVSEESIHPDQSLGAWIAAYSHCVSGDSGGDRSEDELDVTC